MVDDLRTAFRQIRCNPGFSVAVVLTLALGVGATAAVFTLADPMLFRPLPFPDSDRLVRVRVNGPQGQPSGTMPLAEYLRMEERHSGFSAVCSFNIQLAGRLEGFEGAVSVNGIPGAVSVYGFTGGCFDTFGMRPVMGRAFLPEEIPAPDQPATVAVVTDAFWRTALGGRPDVIGQTVRFAGPRPQAFVIVGVMPPEFFVPQTINPPPSLMIPSRVNPARAAEARVSDVIARLASGVPIEAAAAEAQRMVEDVERDFPSLPQRRLSEVLHLQQALFGSVRNPLLLLLGATACVLLLACANLAHLFMARLHARDREFGVRIALGVGTWRVARQLMLEATLLALLGGVAAVVFARWAFALIIGLTPDFVWIYRLLPAAVDTRVMLFAAALIGLAIAIYGVIPALFASRTDVRARLQPGGPTSSAVGRSDRLLVFGQAAIAVALLVTGALIVQSFLRFAYQPLGFNPYDVQQVRVELGPALLADPTRTFAVQRAVHDKLRGRSGNAIVVHLRAPDASRAVGRRHPHAGGGKQCPRSTSQLPLCGSTSERSGNHASSPPCLARSRCSRSL